MCQSQYALDTSKKILENTPTTPDKVAIYQAVVRVEVALGLRYKGHFSCAHSRLPHRVKLALLAQSPTKTPAQAMILR